MIELYIILSAFGVWGKPPQISVNPGVIQYSDHHTFNLEPSNLNWSPEDGFWLEYNFSMGPRIELLDGDNSYYYYEYEE